MTEEKLEGYSYNNIVPAGTNIYHLNPRGLYFPKIYKYHLDTNSPLIVKEASGMLRTKEEEMFSFIEEHGGKLSINNLDNDFYYLWDNSFLHVEYFKKSNSITFYGCFTDTKLVNMFLEMKDKFITNSKKDSVFSIVRTSMGLDIKNLGNGSSPLIKDNYNAEVITDIEYVIETFKKSPPFGRICIMNGEPGTGKTHLVRSFLSEIDCVFLIIPSNLVSALDSPDFLPLLLKVKDSHELPIILIIEDGDTCLTPRKSDNISTITSLLNLSDGILGAIIDIKIIITTNAHIKDIDQAILRVGRLCKNIHVGPLAYEQSNKIYQRLVENAEAVLEYKKYYTLAEIYNKFNNKNAPVPVSTTRSHPIGFHSPKVIPPYLKDEDLSLNLIK